MKPAPKPKKHTVLPKLGIFISIIYLLNPTLGLVELLPDAILGLGNLDEAFFTGLLIKCLHSLGYTLPFLKLNSARDKTEQGS